MMGISSCIASSFPRWSFHLCKGLHNHFYFFTTQSPGRTTTIHSRVSSTSAQWPLYQCDGCVQKLHWPAIGCLYVCWFSASMATRNFKILPFSAPVPTNTASYPFAIVSRKLPTLVLKCALMPKWRIWLTSSSNTSAGNRKDGIWLRIIPRLLLIVIKINFVTKRCKVTCHCKGCRSLLQLRQLVCHSLIWNNRHEMLNVTLVISGHLLSLQMAAGSSSTLPFWQAGSQGRSHVLPKTPGKHWTPVYHISFRIFTRQQ